MVAGEVRQHALADILGLADINRQVVVAVEQVNTWRLGQIFKNAGIKLRRQARVGILGLEGGIDGFKAALEVNLLPELVDQLGVGQRPVTGLGAQFVALDQTVEVVPLVFGKQGA